MRRRRMKEKFDGYLGHILRLKDGRSVRIMGDEGDEWKPTHKINVIDLDGNTFQCYHGDIQYVWSEN
jgi:hypothetical protein